MNSQTEDILDLGAGSLLIGGLDTDVDLSALVVLIEENEQQGTQEFEV